MRHVGLVCTVVNVLNIEHGLQSAVILVHSHHASTGRDGWSIYKVAVSVSVFLISQKRADRFPWNFSWFIRVIGRRERIKTSGKCRPLMCKNWKNCAKWPILRKSARPRALDCAMACGPSLRARLHAGRVRHGPIARWPGAWPVAFDLGPSQTLLGSWV